MLNQNLFVIADAINDVFLKGKMVIAAELMNPASLSMTLPNNYNDRSTTVSSSFKKL